MTTDQRRIGFSISDAGLALLLVIFILITLCSLTVALHHTGPSHPYFWNAVGPTFVLLGFIPLFVRARFSFGYFAGICFYNAIIGFFWFSYFTVQEYDHELARWSAIISLLLFLLPVLFLTQPLPRALISSQRTMDRFALGLLGLAVAVLAVGASYGFALVGLAQSEILRSTFARPAILNYLIGATVGAVLPFAFAYFAWKRRYVLAGAAIVLIWAFYPVVLNKSVLFGGLLLPYLFVLLRCFEPKRAVIYALLIPMVPGIIAYYLVEDGAISRDGTLGRLAAFLIGSVNVRLFAFPTMAMDLYSEFFTLHRPTHFCQIGIIRAIYGCPYPFQLGTVMAETYNMGNFNGSLFATEGIASVGPIWAPVSALVCGMIVSLGNRASARLPAPLVGTSAGIAVQQALLNAPLSVSLLSNGVLVLWLLWAVTPELREAPEP